MSGRLGKLVRGRFNAEERELALDHGEVRPQASTTLRRTSECRGPALARAAGSVGAAAGGEEDGRCAVEQAGAVRCAGDREVDQVLMCCATPEA